MPRHEDGRYFGRIVVPAPESPHFQPSMVLPPSVVPTTATPEIIGTSVRVLVPAVSAARLVWLPVTVITPFASELPPDTNFVGVIVQAAGSAAEALVTLEFCRVSVTPVRDRERPAIRQITQV